MNRRTFVAVPVALTAVSALRREAAAAPGPIDFTSQVPAPGSFPARWICGSPSCMDNHDPPIQVHWYNEHTVFMRQNKGYSYEAPFMHLYFGNERILMLDQGFTQLRSGLGPAPRGRRLHRQVVRASPAQPAEYGATARVQPPAFGSLCRDRSIRRPPEYAFDGTDA